LWENTFYYFEIGKQEETMDAETLFIILILAFSFGIYQWLRTRYKQKKKRIPYKARIEKLLEDAENPHLEQPTIAPSKLA